MQFCSAYLLNILFDNYCTEYIFSSSSPQWSDAYIFTSCGACSELIQNACSMAHDCPSLIKNPLCFQGQWDVFAPGWSKQPGGGHGRRIGGLESVTQKWRQQKKQCISSSLMYLLHAFKQKADLSCIAFIVCLCLCLCFCVKPTN